MQTHRDMPDKIETATPEQWSQIKNLREQWVADCTHQYSRTEVEEAVADCYHLASLKPPPLILLDSPAACLVTTVAINTGLSPIKIQLGDQLGGQLRGALWGQLRNQLGDQLRGQLGDQLGDQLRNQLGDQLRDQLGDQLGDQLRNLGNNELSAHMNLWWRRSWVGWLLGGEILGVEYDREKLTQYERITTRITWNLPYKNAIIVARAPVQIHWQDGRLHNENGLAVEYADGWGWCALEGVRVPEKIVMAPESQTIEEIQEEENAEIKRIRIERYGWVNYLSATGANAIDRRKNHVHGTVEALYRDGEGNTVLLCGCPLKEGIDRTSKIYAQQVDPECTTCEQAQDWLSSGLASRSLCGH